MLPAPRFIFHIAGRSDWEEQAASDAYTPPGFERERFIHCALIRQVPGVAERYFAGRADLVLVAIDTAKLTAPLVFEDTTGRGEAFPHIYGPLARSAVAGYSALAAVGSPILLPPEFRSIAWEVERPPRDQPPEREPEGS